MLTFLNGKYKLSNAAVQAMASLWFIVISVTMLIIAMFTYTLVTGKRTDDLPYAALASLGLVAVVAVISSMALYIAMWSYWFIVERSSVGVRLLWLLALLFGIHYGAAIYAYKVWAKNLKKKYQMVRRRGYQSRESLYESARTQVSAPSGAKALDPIGPSTYGLKPVPFKANSTRSRPDQPQPRISWAFRPGVFPLCGCGLRGSSG